MTEKKKGGLAHEERGNQVQLETRHSDCSLCNATSNGWVGVSQEMKDKSERRCNEPSLEKRSST
jgi:hypothetical protein